MTSWRSWYQEIHKQVNLDVVVHICNPSTREAEAGGLPVRRQPGLHQSQKKEKKKRRKEMFTNHSYEAGRLGFGDFYLNISLKLAMCILYCEAIKALYLSPTLP
jgi:hypothetical protein